MLNALKRIPDVDLCNLCAFPQKNLREADVYSQTQRVISQVSALQQLAELELEMLPVIDQLNDVEILFDIKGWYESQQELRERIKDLELYFNIDTALDNETPSLVEQLCIKT